VRGRAATLLAAAAAAALSAASARAEAAGAPRLLVVVAVDQLRPDRLDAALPGGLGRLVREGRSFDGWLDHAMTETCPGHATMLSGRHPAAVGIPSNEFFDAASGAEVYCVHDPGEDAREIGGTSGLSPARLRADALGDWLKRARPGSRVFAVAGKDRGAIVLGGKAPDGAYWFRAGAPPRFTTSRYYRDALPAWVEAWNGARPPEDGFLAALPDAWEHPGGSGGGTPDDFPGEGERFSRTSPHPLRAADLERFGEQLFASPFLDELTLEFARRLVEAEDLGRGPATDLLALSLSATDIVGHTYGPASREAEDALRRLDAAFGRFLAFLEARAPGAVTVALTADHGVLPLPEWLERSGQATCPAPGGRTSALRVGADLLVRLWWRHGPWLAWPRAWVRFAGSQGRVDRALAARRGLAPEAVAAEAKAVLEAWPAVARVWTAAEIAAGGGETAELYRRSFVPDRSGDFVVQPARGCLISYHDTGTTHGSPWEYDRRVPLVLFGAGVAPGAAGRAATVDLAPTLAALLGVPAPPDLDGRPLPLPPAR
jgi:predicted AlkP superfamily pyrophosphatase or phosphodiesterase